ncbi:MAG: hypothetical protein FJ278_14920, partial [Planctomycetes bacterium]|nr:hypothetical protein [Planctomycetota bacterium]
MAMAKTDRQVERTGSSRSSSKPIHSPRGRRQRLKLDELEPRIAPSSLLYSLPAFGMVDGGSGFTVHGSGLTVQDSGEEAADPPLRVRGLEAADGLWPIADDSLQTLATGDSPSAIRQVVRHELAEAEAVDTDGPRVTSMGPPPNLIVGAASQVTVTFNEDLAPATVNANTVRLSSDDGPDHQWGTADDTYVNGTVAYDAATDRATFTPVAALAVGRYAVWLDGDNGITDLVGNRLDGEYTNAFPTGNIAPGGNFLATFTLNPSNPECVSVASHGTLGSGNSYAPSISSDGRFVAFFGDATNLAAGDTNDREDVFVYDRQTDTAERVSVSSTGAQANGHSQDPALSADGRYVAFTSWASDLVGGDANGTSDIFLHERQTDTTQRVSVSSSGDDADGRSSAPALSADGDYVAFQSEATNLVPGDTNSSEDVFLYHRSTATVQRVSVSSSGGQADQASSAPALSSDGGYVAFVSSAHNLVDEDTNNQDDIFVYERSTGEVERVSVASDGAQSNGGSDAPSLSANG